MAAEELFWLSGLSLVIGGTATSAGWIMFAVLDPAHQEHRHRRWLPLNALIIGGGIFMALGLPGFYARQAQAAGLLGLVGFVLLFVGIAVPYLAVHSVETLTAPNIPSLFQYWVAVGAPSAFLGILITGVATWRAGVYPQAAGILLLLSALVGPLTVSRTFPPVLRRNLLPAVFTITVAWLGSLLLG